jgi:hypothetical protein
MQRNDVPLKIRVIIGSWCWLWGLLLSWVVEAWGVGAKNIILAKSFLRIRVFAGYMAVFSQKLLYDTTFGRL